MEEVVGEDDELVGVSGHGPDHRNRPVLPDKHTLIIFHALTVNLKLKALMSNFLFSKKNKKNLNQITHS